MAQTTIAPPGSHRVEGRPKVIDRLGGELVVKWDFPKPPQRRFALTALLVRDEDVWAISVAQLPGVFTHAENERQAIEHVIEAATGAIELYLEAGENVPWRSEDEEAEVCALAEKCLAFEVTVNG